MVNLDLKFGGKLVTLVPCQLPRNVQKFYSNMWVWRSPMGELVVQKFMPYDNVEDRYNAFFESPPEQERTKAGLPTKELRELHPTIGGYSPISFSSGNYESAQLVVDQTFANLKYAYNWFRQFEGDLGEILEGEIQEHVEFQSA